jgi:nuclear pore complex protein Nup155
MQSPHTTPDLPLLQGTSQVIQDYFVKDSQVIPDTGELLVLRRSVQPRAQCKILIPSPPAGVPSSASYSVSPDDYRVPFQKRRLIAIPERLFQFFNSPFFLLHRISILTPI